MMDTTDKSNDAKDGDALVIEVEAESTERTTATIDDTPGGAPHTASGAGFVWLLAALIVIGGGGYAAWPYYGHMADPYVKKARAMLGLELRPTQPSLSRSAQPMRPAPITEPTPTFEPAPVPDPGPPSALVEAPASVSAPLETVQDRLAPLDSDTSSNTPSDTVPILNSLAARMDILENQINVAVQNAGPGESRAILDTNVQLTRTLSELKAEIATLKTRLNAMENTPRGLIDPSASAQALVLAVTQLRTQASGAGSFEAALDALERLGGADPVIAAAVVRLRPHAPSGVVSSAALSAGFKTMAADVMRAHSQSKTRGWWGEVTNTVTGLVTVRRTDPARIDDPVERALAVAEQALVKGDLKTAVAALASLAGMTADAASGWREAAQARVDVQEALDVLHAHAVVALSATGGV